MDPSPLLIDGSDFLDEVRRRLPEFIGRIDSYCSNMRPLIYPKELQVPPGFVCPTLYAISAFNGINTVMQGTRPEADVTCWAIHITTSQLIRLQMPTYFVSGDLCAALLQTEAPEDLRFNEIDWPMLSMLFMLPTEFSVQYFGCPVPYVTVSTFPERFNASTPLLWHGQPVPTIPVDPGKPFFSATMLAWEEGLPMHYDSRCPMDLRVKDLIDSGITHYAQFTGEAIRTKEQDRQTVNRLTNLAVNILLGMTAEPELITRERIIRPAKKDGKKVLRRALWKPNMIGEHFRVTYESTAPHGTHASPHAHWRRGHHRTQRHGPKNTLVKRIWIKPVFVGLKEHAL